MRIITKIRILTVFGVICVGDSCQSSNQQKKPHVWSIRLEIHTMFNDSEQQAPALLRAVIKRKRSTEANNKVLRTAQFMKQPIINFTHCYWVNCERTGLLHCIKRRVVESPWRPSIIFFRLPSLVFYSVTCELGPLFACMFVCSLCFFYSGSWWRLVLLRLFREQSLPFVLNNSFISSVEINFNGLTLQCRSLYKRK